MSRFPTCYCEVPGARLAYIEHGSGKPVIFIHGNSGDKRFFSGILQELGDSCHGYALDSRCHGETVSASSELSFSLISDEVIAFCQAQKMDQAEVVGFSDGGIVALQLAHKAPSLFPKIIAISPNYLASGLTPGGLRSMHIYRGIVIALQRLGLKLDRARARVDLVVSDSGLTEADLRHIRTNVHLVSAEHDMISQEHLQQIASLVPGIQWHVIPHSTHLSVMFKQEMRQLLAALLGQPEGEVVL